MKGLDDDDKEQKQRQEEILCNIIKGAENKKQKLFFIHLDSHISCLCKEHFGVIKNKKKYFK